MPFYALVQPGREKDIQFAVAANQTEALGIFSKQLGYELTDNKNLRHIGQKMGPDFNLDEWEENPHWLNHSLIPVWRKEL